MKHRVLEISSFLVVIVVISSIWIPVVSHHYYYVPPVTITAEMINRARSSPSDQLLEELMRYRLFMGRNKAHRGYDQQVINVAEKLLRGELAIPGYPVKKINLPSYHADFYSTTFKKKGAPTNLSKAIIGFFIPQILLSAHEKTGRDDFLEAARDMILAWERYEQQVQSSRERAILWDDGPNSRRIFVLVTFWRFYRNSPVYEPDVAKRLFELVTRIGQHLARPSEYVFRSNHGVMQNLGLWHLCLAFPTLPKTDQFKEIAFNRMHNQLDAYVNEEGVVTEHSAFYVEAGLQFLSMALRYLVLLNIDVPDKWITKYEKLKDFFSHLRRPDGSLPVFGDSFGGKPPALFAPLRNYITDNIVQCTPTQSSSLYPVGGYSIWWDGLENWPKLENLAQTVTAWSHFPWGVHKHADELSVLLWAAGQTWWTNVGYWPSSHSGRSDAISWEGSNAPHLVGENRKSARKTRVLSHGASERLVSIELERVGPDGYIVNRQLMHLQPNLWIVIDRTHGTPNGWSRTIWTTSHNVNVAEGQMRGAYNLVSEDKDVSLTTFFLGSEGTKVNKRIGSSKPFAGWEVVYENSLTGWDISPVIRPTTSIVVEQSAKDSWSAAIWSLNKGEEPGFRFVDSPRMARWISASDWQLNFYTTRGPLEIQRKDTKISVRTGAIAESNSELSLIEVPNRSDIYQESKKAYINASKVRGTFGAERKITLLLIVLFVVQEILLLIYKHKVKKHYVGIRTLAIVGWVIIGFTLPAFGGSVLAWYRGL